MEKDIMKALDNLTMAQTERLLDDNMEIRISERERNRIKNAVFEKIGFKKKKRYLHKKIVPYVASFVLIFASLSIVGFDNVTATVGKFFTFIPGKGIVERNNDATGDTIRDAEIYLIDFIVVQIKDNNSKANIDKAFYTNNNLSVRVLIEKNCGYEDLTLYINNKPAKINEKKSSRGVILDPDDPLTMLDLVYNITAPTSEDIYEIAITGFTEKLSFKLVPCRDYDDVSKIGSTAIQNGIAIIATAQRIDDELTVWCYPFDTTNTLEDRIINYDMYIDTESERLLDKKRIGQGQSNEDKHKVDYSVFDLPEKNETLTLYIPDLTLLRDEKKVINLELPEGYTTVKTDISVDCSLGMIRITEIERARDSDEDGKDSIHLKLELNSHDSNMILSSFELFIESGHGFSYGEKGIDSLSFNVERNVNSFPLNISGLYYTLLGEYVIPLEIQ